jgi:hypothetical protein
VRNTPNKRKLKGNEVKKYEKFKIKTMRSSRRKKTEGENHGGKQ